MSEVDAVVVGAGPNGLAAAIAIAQTGRTVVVFEAATTVGGACRSAELTLPGFLHDVCSAVHPFAVASPFFSSLPLGIEWLTPSTMLAHPLDRSSSACLYGSVERTAANLRGDDEAAYRQLFTPLVDSWPKIAEAVLGPFRWPRHPFALARFGIRALQPAATVARRAFSGERARALFGGTAAHSMLPLEKRPSAGFALALTIGAHVGGWCIPKGGAQRVADALAAHLRSLRGEIVTNTMVKSIDALPQAKAILFDLSPRPLLAIAGDRFPPRFRRALASYRYGMGVFKVDWALEGAIPWSDRACADAATIHLGGTFDEIAAAERQTWQGGHPERPFVLLSQPTVVDSSRAPQGRHVVWGYCHVPSGSGVDMLSRIERQIERFAPGFRDRVMARAVRRPADLERDNPNLVGGDIGGGAPTMDQLFTRPTWRTYSTPARGIYICSSSTPPGGGVHGMCGYFAAQRALREVLRD